MLIVVLYVAAILFGILGWGRLLAAEAATICRLGSFALGFIAFVFARPAIEVYAQARMQAGTQIIFMIFFMLGFCLIPNFVGGVIVRAWKRNC